MYKKSALGKTTKIDGRIRVHTSCKTTWPTESAVPTTVFRPIQSATHPPLLTRCKDEDNVSGHIYTIIVVVNTCNVLRSYSDHVWYIYLMRCVEFIDIIITAYIRIVKIPFAWRSYAQERVNRERERERKRKRNKPLLIIVVERSETFRGRTYDAGRYNFIKVNYRVQNGQGRSESRTLQLI